MHTLKIRNAMMLCGFCSYSGRHDLCPGAVRNGNGQMIPCQCSEPGCNAGKPRCTECGNRESATVGPDWRCIDTRDCQAAQQVKRENDELLARVRAARERARESQAAEARMHHPASPSSGEAPPRLSGRECWCNCGQPTAGGRFLPGHDSRYLSALVANAAIGGPQLEQSRIEAGRVSPAFLAKFEKRIGAKK